MKPSDNQFEHNITTLIYKRTVIYSALLLVFLLVVTGSIYVILSKDIIQNRQSEQFAEVDNIKKALISELTNITTDLTYYSHSNVAQDTLLNQDVNAKNYTTSLMYNISALYKKYDQIRLLNSAGTEVIRIDLEADSTLEIIEGTKLQNKADRYYFKDLFRLNQQAIYISKFDLNVEHNQVELPIKPTVRFATPIHANNGDFIGAGVINYNGTYLLELMNELNVHVGDQVFLLNSDGYYLKGVDASKEWRFMFPEQEQIGFATDLPEVWHEMQKEVSGKISTDKGEYYFSHFQLSPSSSFNINNAEKVFLVMFVPSAIIYGQNRTLFKGLFIGLILFSPMFFYLAFQLARSQVRHNRLFEKLNFEARHDGLTGLYNRKAILEYLEQQIKMSLRTQNPLTVSFIDVNDLKKTNDTYGHDAGDELIQGVASAINSSIRDTDYSARLGGDEFLIIFVDCNVASANKVMNRIQSIYAELGVSTKGKQWALSFGCTELIAGTDSVDSLIERADAAMYQHKLMQKADKA